jgi:hypothetical protein
VTGALLAGAVISGVLATILLVAVAALIIMAERS